jgi:hypothetical protein
MTKPAAQPKSAPSWKGRPVILCSRGSGARAGTLTRAVPGATTPTTTCGSRHSWRP